MTTRYENTDGMDDSISFGEQVIRPSIQEVCGLLNYIYRNNQNLDEHPGIDKSKQLSRDEVRDQILYIVDNNKNVALTLDGRVTINRLRKE